MEKAFEAKYPQYDVVREAAGSRACARKITDIGKPADVMASADYKVIDNLLIPDFAKFNAHFATNEMVIAYTPHSKYAKEINSSNWPQIFLKEGVKVGHSNPNLDPCGYRSMLVTKLAERYYTVPGFFEKLFGYGESYSNGEEKRSKVIVRPKETDLLALLESGVYDYLFIYRSVAQQHGLKFIELPKEVNLGTARMGPLYEKVSFKITGKKPGTLITKKGAPMVYGVTIVDDGKALPPHPEGAKAFVRFLLSPEGMKIMQENGQGVIDPPVVTGDASRVEL
jgi:molybdate/tungstate transport system substrate-binding protein